MVHVLFRLLEKRIFEPRAVAAFIEEIRQGDFPNHPEMRHH